MKLPKPMNLILIGGIITITGGIITLFGTYRQNIASSKRMESLQSVTEETNKTTKDQYTYTLGGPGFCQAEFWKEGSDQMAVFFKNNSKLPIYDLEINIRDNDCPQIVIKMNKKLIEPGGEKINILKHAFDECDIKLGVKSIDADTKIILGAFPLKLYGDLRSFTIHTVLRNGSFIQELRFFNIGNNEWLKAERIINENTKTIVFEHIPDIFPKDKLRW